jgi:antagonist of KipI
MSIRITKSGFLSTLQDIGRPGFQSEGVPVCGSMDTDALITANLLVGNAENSCCIEFTLHGAEIKTEEDILIAFTGGGARVQADNSEIPFGKSVHIRKGSTVKLIDSLQGCRSYLAVGGGFRADKIMNSASTYLPSAFGGLGGRALQNGDFLEVNQEMSLVAKKIKASLPLSTQNFSVASWGLNNPKTSFSKSVRVVTGPEWNWLSGKAQKEFYDLKFSVLPSSNRMGIRLQSEKLERIDNKELLSTSVSKGTIQCTPDGNAILLMSDCQTTGGYPRIAQVAAVDLSDCAQLRAADKLQCVNISFAEAERLFLDRQRKKGEIKRSIATRFNL